MSPTIRNATPSDTPQILQFIRDLAEFEKLAHEVQADEATLHQSLFGANAKAFALMVDVDGKAAGFCLCFYNFSTFLGRPGIYIEDIYVDPAYRSQGIGKLFFQHLAARADAEGCGRIEWWVLDWNQRAIDFYESMGANPMDEWTVYRLTRDKFAALKQPATEAA